MGRKNTLPRPEQAPAVPPPAQQARPVAVVDMHRYYPVTVPFAFPVLLGGLCLLAIGQPRSDAGPPALWGRILLVTSATIGAGVGLAVSFLLLG